MRWLPLLLLPAVISAVEFHVATHGDDTAAGSATAPFLSVNHAAQLAQAGDVVVVHAGVYREQVAPLHGGTAAEPITYRAATGEAVRLTGSALTIDHDFLDAPRAQQSAVGPFATAQPLVNRLVFDAAVVGARAVGAPTH